MMRRKRRRRGMYGCDVFDCVPVMSRCIVFQQTSAIHMTNTPSVRWCARLDPSNADPVNPRIDKAIDKSSPSSRAKYGHRPVRDSAFQPGWFKARLKHGSLAAIVSRRHIAAKGSIGYICTLVKRGSGILSAVHWRLPPRSTRRLATACCSTCIRRPQQPSSSCDGACASRCPRTPSRPMPCSMVREPGSR